MKGKKKDSVSSVMKSEAEELSKDNLDIKSYISQSRSDIGPYEYSSNSEFIRTGSYRSQYGRSPIGELSYLHRVGSNRSRRGRSPNYDGLEPTQRTRSATVSVGNIQKPKYSLDVPSRLSSIVALEEGSNQSRKDSGIRSNSRRSSTSTQHVSIKSKSNHMSSFDKVSILLYMKVFMRLFNFVFTSASFKGLER